MFFNEDHLRITKIKTVNGITPQTGDDERPVKKIILAPLNKDTRKLFEDQNKRLPNNIKMKIEVVKAYKPESIISNNENDNSITEQKNKELEEQNKKLLEQIQKLNAEAKNLSSENGNSIVDPKKEKTNASKNVSNETV